MSKNIIRTATITALAGVGLALGIVGTGGASAQPYEGIEDGTYSVIADLALPGVIGGPSTSIPAGTAIIHDGTLIYNGQSGRITKTPDADYASAVATLPVYGPVALLPDGVSGRDVELILGVTNPNDPASFTAILSLHKR